MGSKDSRIITISMPLGLLAQVDVLAKKNFATRSDILRQAAVAYIRQLDLDAEEVKRVSPEYAGGRQRPEPKPEEKPKHDFVALAKKYPMVRPEDHVWLAALDDMDNDRI